MPSFSAQNRSKDYLTIHLRNLVAMARADGQLDNAEILFLYKIGKRYQLNPQLIADILSEKHTDYEVNVSKVEDSLEQLTDLVGMMVADGIIREKEMEFCKKMCSRFGFQLEVIDLLVELYKKEKINQVEWEEVKMKALSLR